MSDKKPVKSRPASKVRVGVRLKSEYTDVEGEAALSLLQGCGLHTARSVRVSKLYEIHGQFNQGHLQTAAKELLCDNITQEFKIQGLVPSLNGSNNWRVEVWLKPTMTDPVGETVREALAELGLPPTEKVRHGIAYHITGKCGRNHIEKVALKTLANPVIHRLTITEEHS